MSAPQETFPAALSSIRLYDSRHISKGWSPLMGAGKQAVRRISRNAISLALGLAAVLWIPVSFVAQAKLMQQHASAPPQSPSSGPSARLPHPAPPGVKTAGQAFKNVEVLTDVPADQLMPSMRYITFALGVRCDYCHNQDHFESDEKPAKKRAR